MSFFDSTLHHLDNCFVALATKFAPYYIMGVCNHVINLENQKREFYYEHGKVANLRTHVFMCAPPGFTKTLYLEKFLRGGTSIVGCSQLIQSTFEGSMTEAAFTGTVKVVNGDPVEAKGAAYDARYSILGVDEFASLTNSMRQEHSVNLDNAMLTALDTGYLTKRLALGKIQYMTQLTLFTGSQPMRFNLTSGLGRRFIYIWFIPTRKEEDMIRDMRRKAKSQKPNLTWMEQVKRDLEMVVQNCQKIQSINFHDNVFKTLDELHIPHFEEVLYERMSIGYTLAKLEGSCGDVLEVRMTDELKNLFRVANDWREEIKKGADTSQVFQIVKEMNGASVSDIKVRLTNLGMTYQQSSEVMQSLQHQSRIRYVTDAPVGNGRPRTRVIVAEE